LNQTRTIIYVSKTDGTLSVPRFIGIRKPFLPQATAIYRPTVETSSESGGFFMGFA